MSLRAPQLRHLRFALRTPVLPRFRYNSTLSSPPHPPKPNTSQDRNASTSSSTSSPASADDKGNFSTLLAKQLTEAIKVTGPIPLAFYMKQCLTSPESGYYTSQHGAPNTDPFGKSGDFITSPEISQMFGEMLGIWIVTEWIKQGRARERVQLIELGPGRGTLMDDMLRTIRQFKALSNAIESVYLIEASPHLRAAQHALLCPGSPLTPTTTGFRSMSKYSIPITWYTSLSEVPSKENRTPFTVAHEFFDALPIHAFQSNGREWRELMVAPTTGSLLTTGGGLQKPRGHTGPEFALVAAKAKTPHSIILPELSARYRALKHMENAVIEVSPESLSIVEEIAQRIGYAHAGAALIIDYGPLDTVPVNSLRGIRKHQLLKSPFEAPGEVDLSADVDFVGLAERACDKEENVEVHGPVEQAGFLEMMGMKERVDMLVRSVLKKSEGEEGEKTAEELSGQYRRLTDRGVNGMGKIYKAMAIVPERGGKPPVGFGGGLDL